MGVTIEFFSSQGYGTTFFVKIPFEIDDSYESRQQEIAADEKIRLDGNKIIIAEDNELNMEIARFQLEQEEIEVFTASNGKEAVEMFEASQPGFYDIILMDIMMPVMDGLEATRHIRSMNRRDSKTIPIVAMSANAFQEDVEKSLAAGLNEYLTKPLDEKKLTETMKKYLGKKMR